MGTLSKNYRHRRNHLFQRVHDMAAATHRELHVSCRSPLCFYLIVVLAGLLIFARPISAFASGIVSPIPQSTAQIVQYRPVEVYVLWGNSCQWQGPVALRGDPASTPTQACKNAAAEWNARPDLNFYCTNSSTSNWGSQLYYASDSGGNCSFYFCGLGPPPSNVTNCNQTYGRVEGYVTCPAGYTISGSTCLTNTCPANATLSGSTCTCDAGYQARPHWDKLCACRHLPGYAIEQSAFHRRMLDFSGGWKRSGCQQ